MRAWRGEKLPPQRRTTVFYPFSGPDILPLLALYPQANDILLFGLEVIGELPDPLMLPRERVIGDLAGLNEALEFIFKHSFFVTKDMETQVAAANPYTGVAGVLFFLLARGGFTVVDAQHLALDRSGALSARRVAVADLEKPAEAVPVLEIDFRAGDEPALRRLRYVNANIGDWSETRYHLLAYLEDWGPASTMIKSASYLLHNETHFSAMRRAIMRLSAEILQDDSGIPYRAFMGADWVMTFHGRYHKPLSFFMQYLQPDLERAVAAGSSGPLPFDYGYGYAYKTITYHVMHAVKRHR
jgi:hypothetical protein